MRSVSLVRSVSLFTLAMVVAGCDVGSESDSDDSKSPDDGASDASSAPFFLPTGEPDNTAAPAIEIDGKGRVHAVFPAYAGGRAYYATCAADCAGTDEVQVVRFDTDSTVANAMLALDGDGRPRVLLSTFNKVYFASCDDGCSDPAAWSQTELLDHRGDREVTGEAFALDVDGNPRFMMHTYVAYLGIGQKAPETYYVACDGACDDAASWSEHKVADQIWQSSTLRFDATGRAHLATIAHVVESDASTSLTGAYVACEGGCDAADSWIGKGLEPAFSSELDAVKIKPAISLALTSSGSPRIAVLGRDAAMQRQVVYLACDDACTTDGWQGIVLSNAREIGAGLDLALDAEDQPRIAYTYDYNIGILHCDAADCTPESAPWDVAKVEISSEMDPDTIFLEENCTVGAWFLHSPSIALGPSGAPRVGYQARDISGGWDNPDEAKPDCVAGTDMTWSRLAMLGAI